MPPIANDSKPEDFNIDENGVLVKYLGSGGDVVIPDGVLYSNDMRELLRCPRAKTNVAFPESVTRICVRAFKGCDRLTDAAIPESVNRIDAWVFWNCSNLRTVLIPDSVTKISVNVFEGCPELTIYGNKGSVAEAYAKHYRIPFKPIGGEGDLIEISECTITAKDQVYTGKKLEPEVTVKYGKQTLEEGSDYTVTYKHNKAIGTATATVKGKGGFTGKAEATFRIDPKAVTGLKLSAGEGKIDARWKKVPGGVTGYELEYGLKKDFSDAETVTVKKANAIRRMLSSLESGKTYYVRARAYKKVDKTTFYSAWSSAEKAKVR